MYKSSDPTWLRRLADAEGGLSAIAFPELCSGTYSIFSTMPSMPFTILGSAHPGLRAVPSTWKV